MHSSKHCCALGAQELHKFTAESSEIELICFKIPRVPWLALTLGLTMSLYQNYEGDHGWVFPDKTFLQPDNISQ